MLSMYFGFLVPVCTSMWEPCMILGIWSMEWWNIMKIWVLTSLVYFWRPKYFTFNKMSVWRSFQSLLWLPLLQNIGLHLIIYCSNLLGVCIWLFEWLKIKHYIYWCHYLYYLSEIWGSYDGGDGDFCLLGYDTM